MRAPGVADDEAGANDGPVFITDRGRPAYILLNIQEYQRLTCGGPKIADLLSMPRIERVLIEQLTVS